MFLHYNNGEKEKLIKDIHSIQIIDGNTPAIVALKSGGELIIRLDRIEAIVDDSVLKGEDNEIYTYQHTPEVVRPHSERREDDRGAQDATEDRNAVQVLHIRDKSAVGYAYIR